MFGRDKKPVMPTRDEALPGRDEPLAVPDAHFVNGNPLKGPFPSNLREAVFGLGCFWGAERRAVDDFKTLLNLGADKIVVNTAALETPDLITAASRLFGSQCVVIGIDSREENGDYFVYQYTGDPEKTTAAQRKTIVRAVQQNPALLSRLLNRQLHINGWSKIEM